MAREESITTGIKFEKIRSDHGLNKETQRMLRGDYTVQDISLEMDAWLRMIAQTKEERHSPMIEGVTSKEEFQLASSQML